MSWRACTRFQDLGYRVSGLGAWYVVAGVDEGSGFGRMLPRGSGGA